MLNTPSRPTRPSTTKVQCPKCRSRDLYLTEIGEWTTQWEVREGRLDREAGYHEPGAIDHLEARCIGCRHLWRIRGAHQIDGVVSPVPNEPAP